MAVERDRYLLRAGRIQAMDDRLDLPSSCDVLIVDGRIEALSNFALHRLAGAYVPEDHYAAVRSVAIVALNAGVTTCHSWANALRNSEDAQAEVSALVDSGIRARFGYVCLYPPNTPVDGLQDLAGM